MSKTITTTDRAAALEKKRAKLQAKKEKAAEKQEVKKNLAQSSAITKMRLAEEFIDPIGQTIFDEAGGEAYDIVQEEAYEMLRALMAFYELSQTDEGRASLANFFNANAAHLGKLFTENDYKNFTIK